MKDILLFSLWDPVMSEPISEIRDILINLDSICFHHMNLTVSFTKELLTASLVFQEAREKIYLPKSKDSFMFCI